MSVPRSCADGCSGDCSWLFADLGPEALAKIREMSRPLRFERGQVIFEEGEPAFGLYIICQGKVKLAKHSLRGKKQILKLLGPGEILGEKTLFDREVYTAYAEALEETQLFFIEREPFIEFLKSYPRIALRLIEKLSRELKAFQNKLMETSYEGSLERLARLLLLMGSRYGVPTEKGLDIGVQLSRQELAELAGISTETAIRMLSRMKDRGLIALEGSKVYLVDRRGLRDLAGPLLITLKENLI
jgi:CRP/FNR family transcriptional regulator